MVQMIPILLFFFITRNTLGQEEDLWCYECGTGVVGEPDCLGFSLATSWRPFWRQCQKDSVCVKTMQAWDTNNELGVVRGCTPRVSLAGTVHRDGCWSYTASATITCYCTNHLCNNARAFKITTPTLVFVNSFLIFILNYCR